MIYHLLLWFTIYDLPSTFMTYHLLLWLTIYFYNLPSTFITYHLRYIHFRLVLYHTALFCSCISVRYHGIVEASNSSLSLNNVSGTKIEYVPTKRPSSHWTRYGLLRTTWMFGPSTHRFRIRTKEKGSWWI